MNDAERDAARRASAKLNAWIAKALQDAVLEVRSEDAPSMAEVEAQMRRLMGDRRARQDGLDIGSWVGTRMREAATKSLRSVDHRESSTKNRREKQQLLAALRAIAEGYPVERSDDRYITVENPDYRPHDGSDPSICIDIHRVKEWLTKG